MPTDTDGSLRLRDNTAAYVRPLGMQPKRIVLISMLLAACALMLFLPVCRFGYVDYDDSQYIRDNPNVASGLSVAGLRWAFCGPQLNYWEPLTWISHMIDCEMFGLNPGAHHIVNLLFHTANTVLLFLLLQSATGLAGRSAWIAALFAVHPLHVESVAWLAERKGLLSTFFCFLSLLAYVRYAKADSWKSYVLTALFFLFGCMAKPIVVTLPVLLLLMDFWPLNRFHRRRMWQILVEKVPLFGISAIVSWIIVWATRQSGSYLSMDEISLGFRLSKIPVSYKEYLAKTFWPRDLCVIYPPPDQWAGSELLLGTLMVVAITVFVLVQLRRRYLAVGWFWFLTCLLPGLGIIAAGSQQVMSDRFAYVAVVGIFIMLVWSFPDLVVTLRGSNWSKTLSLNLLAGASVIICAYLSAIQLRAWRDPEALWSHAVRITDKNSGSIEAHLRLASVLEGKKNFRSAIEQYREALRLQPNLPVTLNNLAWVLATNPNGDLRRGTEAVTLAERACEITRREQPLFLGTLAAAYAEAGKFEKAVQTAREARDLARRLGQDALAARNEQLLAVYQSGHPWREGE